MSGVGGASAHECSVHHWGTATSGHIWPDPHTLYLTLPNLFISNTLGSRRLGVLINSEWDKMQPRMLLPAGSSLPVRGYLDGQAYQLRSA